MKKIFLSLILTGCVITTFAQNTTETFANKDNVLGVGFGIGGVYGFSSYDAQSPVFGIMYDRGVYEFKFGGVIGAGGFMGYKTYVDKIGGYHANGHYDEFRVRSTVLIFGARGTFHYDVFKVDNLDTYGAAMIAFHVVNEKDDFPDEYHYNDTHSNAAYASLHAGARYYFTDAFGAYAEVGYGVYWLGMGINFKF